MGDYSYSDHVYVFRMGGMFGVDPNTVIAPGTVTDLDNDDVFQPDGSETATGFGTYAGTWTFGGVVMPVFKDGRNDFNVLVPEGVSPSLVNAAEITGEPTATDYAFCFGAGTMIATPTGAVAVETLSIGDAVCT